eukprot:tig00000881_g5222.t1
MTTAALEARLAALEAAVGVQRDARGFLDSRTAREAVAEVDTLYKSVESKEVAEFFRKYAQLDASLSADADLSFLNSETKAAVILANEEMLRETAGHLESVSKLQQFVEPAGLEGVPGMAQRLKPMEALRGEQQEAAALLDGRLEAFLRSYNDIVGTLSEKFAHVDILLSHLEASVEGAAAPAPAPK